MVSLFSRGKCRVFVGYPGFIVVLIDCVIICARDATADGAVVPAGVNSARLLKSTDRGVTWSELTVPAAVTGAINLIAVAPDDADLVAFAGNVLALGTNLTVYSSTSGGTTFGSLGTVQSGSAVAATALYDLDISPESVGSHYITLAGTAGARKSAGTVFVP